MRPFEPEQQLLNRSPLDDHKLLSGHFWAELRVFLAVAKAKSFNRAAEVLNTSQPTVSRQVKRLQDLMGSQLFVPTQHGVKLTPKGEELAKALAKLDQEIYSLSNDLKGESRQAEGVVRVAVTDGLNSFFIAPALPRFTTDYPKIQLHLKSPINVIQLQDNQTDLMIGFVPIKSAEVTQKQLGFMHFVPVATKGYIKAHGLPRRNNLKNHLFLQSEFYSARTGLWDPWSYVVARGRIAHFCDNSFAYGMLVKAGLGIGLLASYTLLEPTAVPLELDVHIKVPLYVMALTERLNARPVRLAFDWLTEIFGPDNPWFREDLILQHPPTVYDLGFKQLFNAG